MNELEKLINERNAMVAVLERINDTITSAQIIKEGHMRMFGFNKKTVGERIVIYAKVVNGTPYEIILDLAYPNVITMHRGKQKNTYGFEIDTVEDFRDLLIFSHLI